MFNVDAGRLRFTAGNSISFTFSDFYIVESQTLPLDSYNASPDDRIDQNVPLDQIAKFPLKGDRKNILATIPISESNGEVVFETNTPIFINIKNIGTDNIRNLKFRILDKDFNEVETTATTNMTILIEG